MITQTELLDYLSYDCLTGKFFAKKASINRPAGRELGTLHSTGYVVIRINDKLYKAHRLAWLYVTGKFPDLKIDHINRIKNDNRWENLREVSHTQNCENNPIKKSNTSGAVGVGWSKQMKKWRARITYGYKEKHLGYFGTLEEAREAYCLAAAKYHTLNPYAKT